MLPDPVLLFFSTSFPTLVRSLVLCLSVCAVCGVDLVVEEACKGLPGRWEEAGQLGDLS